MLLSPEFPFSRPIFPLAFFPGLKPPEGGGLEERKKDGKRKGNVPPPSTHDLSPPNLLLDGCSPRLPLGSRAGRSHFPATARSEATEGGRGESTPPAHLPGQRALRLQWRAGRLCPRPRKPPAPPAAAETSQPLQIATAAAAAAAAAAAQCRSPRCAAERRGFRRELDSWRHRLMHCVGKRDTGRGPGSARRRLRQPEEFVAEGFS